MSNNSQVAKKLPTQIQTLIIGSGVTGLFAAALKLKEGKNVLLVEASDHIGGRNSPELRDGFQFGASFAFSQISSLEKIAAKLDLPLDYISLENGAALMHSPKGWLAPEELPSWEAYFAEPVLQFPRGGLAGICQKLKKYCENFSNFTLQLNMPVTGINIEEAKVKSIALGSEQEIFVDECLWTGSFRPLMDLLQGEGVPAPGPERVSWMRKFNKSQSQPGVVMEFAHNTKLADFTETLLLPFQAGEKEEKRFLVGSFLGNRDSSLAPVGKQVSCWIFPLTDDEWGDNHEIMKKIRAGKRLLDKAFAGFESSVLFERVLVMENTVSPLGRKKGDWQPIYPNLFPFSDWASPIGAHLEGVLSLLNEHC